VAGIALGTAFGAWINVGVLTWIAKNRALLAIENQFLRALPAALYAAVFTGAWAWIGARLLQAQGDVVALASAIICAALSYGVALWFFHERLPLGRGA